MASFSVLFLIGAGYNLKNNAHVRVDVIYQRFNRKLKAWIDLTGSLIFLILGCYLVIKSSIPFVEASW